MTLKDIIELETKLTQMFDSDYRVAMALLEYIREHKHETEDIIDIINSENSGLSAEQRLKEIQETFNTKEK
tara:strand:+ start:143 stop:355 length:213 start_codon:yes stop_codon:yes gene_type:complete